MTTTPSSPFPSSSPQVTVQRVVAVLSRGRGRQLAGLGLLVLASSASPLVGPQLLRVFIDSAQHGRPALLAALAGGFLAASLLHHGLAVLVGYAGTRFAWAATNALREETARHVLGLDLTFFDRHTPGQLIERTDGDAGALASFAASFLVNVVGSTLTLIGVMVIVWLEDWRFGLGMVGFVVAGAASIARLRDFAVEPATERRAASAQLMGEIEERLNGAEDLRTNAGGPHALQRFRQTTQHVVRTSLRASIALRSMWVLSGAVFAAGSVLSLLAGTMLFQSGAISLGTVYLLFRYTNLLREPLDQIAEQQQAAQDAIASLTRIQELLHEQPTIRDTGTIHLPGGPLAIRLEGVGLTYPDGTRALHDLDLHLEQGAVLGVVGRTGSGKTTLTRLLTRLLEPTEGNVRLGGIDARHVPLGDLRQRVALVTQDVQLFDASLRDNLTVFGAHRADDEDLVRVLVELGLGPWLGALPHGLDSVLGHGGQGMSAGEAQLLTFARAFLQDPGLVILDEATSRLDPLREAQLGQAIDRLLAGRTAVLVAHRLGTLDRADKIVVLERGRVAEQGSRRTLVDDAGSRFAGLLAMTEGG